MSQTPTVLADWKHHWQDENDAAYLYRVLADIEPDNRRKEYFERFAAVEDRHVKLWADLIGRNGGTLPERVKPTVKARLMARLARTFGPGFLLPVLLREEGQEVKGYLQLHRDSQSVDARNTALTLAKESAEHAEGLRELTHTEGEPWHKTSSGGYLRNVVYGFNDGLTANFGLLAGVMGGALDHKHAILVGLSGTVADALSMGASGFLAAKSEQEVYTHEIDMERQEIELMPEAEEAELALIYEARGIPQAQAAGLAADVMKDPVRALEEKVREELKIGEAHATPMKEAWIVGLATAIGAFLPVFPFLVSHGTAAIVASFVIAMVSHFGVGGARSIFTGRGIFRSGIDMFVVGLGVAVVGYFVGLGIERL